MHYRVLPGLPAGLLSHVGLNLGAIPVLFLGNPLPHPLKMGLQLGMPVFHSNSLKMAHFSSVSVVLFP